ncbi:MAG: ABC transporter ATP-binding protein [Thermoanaerobaculia bacterium]|nr:ABC transporter ATP-binding protein [Thermoanaerobaculia bacterium]
MSRPGPRTVVEVRNLSRSFGSVLALDDLGFEIHRGEWITLQGPSGSGKTTLLNLLAGLDRPTSGRIEVDGRDLRDLRGKELASYRSRKIGLIFQEFHLVTYLTALENVLLAQYVHSMTDRDQAVRTLERVGMEDRLDHLPGQLSGGEKQRVCVARALINHPPLLLADEPTGNLDEANEERVLELFEELHAEGFTLVVATHNRKLAERGERILLLDHGRLVTGPRQERSVS